MDDKKRTIKRMKWVIFICIVFFMLLSAAHYAIISDYVHGVGCPTDQIAWDWEAPEDPAVMKGIGNADILMETVNHIALNPFSFGGLVVCHIWKPFLIQLAIAGVLAMMYQARKALYHQDRIGEENGSARWYSDFKAYEKEFVSPYTKEMRKKGLSDNNILLAKGLKLSMDTRKTGRNLNVLGVGGSGAGKTFRLIKPNLAQMNCSYVITDPSGEIMESMGTMLMEEGYNVKLFSISDMRHSNVYNPMDYIYAPDGNVDETKVGILVSTFIQNAGDLQKKGGGDQFWTKSATAFMTFGVLYEAEFLPMEKRNMNTLLKLTQYGKTDEDSSSSETALDRIVRAAEAKNPRAKCFSSYKTFKLAPARTANSILISMAVDLNPFASDKVRNLTTTSYVCERNGDGQIRQYQRDKTGKPIRDSMNLDLEQIGDSKTALFVNIPQANSAYNFLVSCMYSQIFNECYDRAEKICPNCYHIYDAQGVAISSNYPTEQAAEHAWTLFREAEVVSVEDKKAGTKRFYLYNKAATMAETLPEMAAKHKKGYLKEVYSEETGKKLIARYQPAKNQDTETGETAGAVITHFPSLFQRFVKKMKSGGASKPKGAYIAHGKRRLPVHVRFLLDEFSNIGEIPDFEKMLSTMRKYAMSCMIILQSLAQIKAKYEKIWEVLVGNCDTVIFLGSNENETDKYFSERLGKETIRIMDESQSRSSNSGSMSNSFKKQGRELLDPAEIGRLHNSQCIVLLRGLLPFKLKKIDFTKHPNFYRTGDKNPERKVNAEYLEVHFRCTSKEAIDASEARAEEEHQKEVMLANKNIKKRGSPARSRKDIADTAGVTEKELDQEAKNAKSVEKEDRSPDVIQTEPVKEAKPEAAVKDSPAFSQANTPEPPQSPGPEDDAEAWIFS